uniref:Rusticalin n=1 Tax=Styela rustica TaxID=1155209 RepID=A0A3Q9DBI9_9ASCI|nr:rusticalin [Styela rustica]
MTLSVFLCLFLTLFVAWSDESTCASRYGVCQDYRYHRCIAGYEQQLCSGNSYIRCCKKCSSKCLRIERFYSSGDDICRSIYGGCMHNSNHCSGTWHNGMCGGPSSRKCCVASSGPTTSGSCSLKQYTNTNVKGYQGKVIRVATGFVNSMDKINLYAKQCRVEVIVTSSFRKSGKPVSGAIVPPVKISNHMVGHAIDMNLMTRGGFCNSRCLAGQRNRHAMCFIRKVEVVV